MVAHRIRRTSPSAASNTADGLAGSLRLAGTGTQVSLWNRLSELRMPTLVMAGELDTKFVDIGRQLASLVPEAVFASIAEADHAAHLQHPDARAGLAAAVAGDQATLSADAFAEPLSRRAPGRWPSAGR